MHRSHAVFFALFALAASMFAGCGPGGGNNGGTTTCTTRAECTDGQRCNAAGQCTADSDSCEFPSDCGVDEYCADGTCDLAACEGDDDCVATAVCDDQRCRSGCRSDDDCGEGEACSATRVCQPAGCTTSSCPQYQACDEALDPPACFYTGDCGNDAHCVAYAQQVDDGNEYLCSAAEQKCVVKPPCAADSDCRIGDICEPRQSDGRMVCRHGCRDDSTCASGEICDLQNLRCVPGCTVDQDCTSPADPNWACVDLVCTPTCSTRNDCLMGQVCKGSPQTCQPCRNNDDCPATQECDYSLGVTEQDEANPLIGLCRDLPPSCPDDGFGDNHSENSAYPVTSVPFQTDAATRPLFCRENGNGEWYEITVQSGEVVEVELNYDNTQGNLDVALRRDMGNEVVAAERPPNEDNGTELLRFGVDLGGTFLVHVRGTIVSSNTNYDLRIDVRQPEACMGDALEPNDQANPAPLSAGSDQVDLEVCGNDADYYLLSVQENQIVKITAEAPMVLGNIDLLLRDSQGLQVAAAQTTGDTELIEVALDDAGDYTLEVRVVSGVGRVVYDLGWTTRDNNCADAYEVNNVCPGAAIPAGSYPDLNLCDDGDYYQIDLLPLQTVTITATYDRAISAGDLDITLLGPNDCSTNLALGQEIPVPNTSQVQEELVFQATTGGTYNLQVFLFSGVQAAYTLDIDIQSGPPCTDDALEPNDNSTQGHLIDRTAAAAGTDNILTGLRMCDTDEDWFRIDLQDGDIIRWDVQFTHANGDVDAELLGPGNVVLDVSDSVTDDESVTYTVPAGEAGTYFLKTKAKFGARTDYWVSTYLNGIGPADPMCPDAYENNDDRAAAKVVGPGSYGLLVCGSPSDDDWFKASVLAGETITVDLTFLQTNGNVDIYLFDDTSMTAVAQGTTASDNESVSYTSARDQDVLWRVTSPTNLAAVSYGMDVSITPAGPCLDDVHQGNTSAATAAAVTAPGLEPRLRMCETVDDWFAVDFVAGKPSEVFINFDGTKADLDLFVYESDQTTLVGSGTTTNDDESVPFTPATTGTYYVKVEAKTNTRLDYDLMLFTDGEGPEDRTCPDIFENNDTTTAPAQIPSGTYDDLLLCAPSDNDYYAIFVPAGATVTVTSTFSHADGNIDLRLLNPQNTPVSTSQTSTDTETVSTTNTGAGATYLLHVFSGGGAFTSYYTLDVALSFGDACANDSAAGDDRASAKSITTGARNLMLCEGEEDWFNLGNVSAVDARIELKNRLGNIDIEVHDANGVVASSNSDGNTEEIDVSGLSGGPYYLRVAPRDGAFIRNGYDLWLSLNGANVSAPWCPDEYERNDDELTADVINAPTTAQYPGLIACGADADWYVVNNLPVQPLELAVFYDHGAGSDVELRVYDDAGMLLETVNTATDDALLSWTPPSSGDYRVVVENVSGSGVQTNYDLLVGRASMYATVNSCPEDTANEPNDNLVTARQVSVPLAGAYGACGDDDYFKFTAATSGSITVTALFDASKLNLGLQVNNLTMGAATVGFSDSDSGNRESVTFTAVAGNQYAVSIQRGLISNTQEDGPYFLRIE